jgi:hypothetical protein
VNAAGLHGGTTVGQAATATVGTPKQIDPSAIRNDLRHHGLRIGRPAFFLSLSVNTAQELGGISQELSRLGLLRPTLLRAESRWIYV